MKICIQLKQQKVCHIYSNTDEWSNLLKTKEKIKMNPVFWRATYRRGLVIKHHKWWNSITFFILLLVSFYRYTFEKYLIFVSLWIRFSVAWYMLNSFTWIYLFFNSSRFYFSILSEVKEFIYLIQWLENV